MVFHNPQPDIFGTVPSPTCWKNQAAMTRSFITALWWQKGHWLSHLLVPSSLVYAAGVALRRWGYQVGLLPIGRLPVPVIVVGNISIGGTGKTPMVIWLAQHLRRNGLRPGVISRGYGRRGQCRLLQVGPDSDPAMAGDEPVLIAKRAACPVVVDKDKLAAGHTLVEILHCDVVLSDDGMQHYGLHRDVEICMIDGERRFGNGRPLPAGPLREPLSRLGEADLLVASRQAQSSEHLMRLHTDTLHNLSGARRSEAVGSWAGQTVHAVAGTAHPEGFFTLLQRRGLNPIAHPFRDHHFFHPQDICFADQLPVVMTEKDAVKCANFCTERHWFLPVHAEPTTAFVQQLDALLSACRWHQGAHKKLQGNHG